jgi:hypothetical protein
MSRVEPQKFLVGDRVKWTGHANGGSVEHEGVIKRIYLAGEPGQRFDQAKVEVSSVNKRTGKPKAVKVYMPRVSALTLVQGRAS